MVGRQVRSPQRLALFQTALEALDRADQAREEVAAGHMTTTTPATGAVHLHPLLRVEREGRTLFAKLWGDLSLRWDPDVDPDPAPAIRPWNPEPRD
ncbi:MAG: hypothetical protein KAY32_10525 [Candidatus Eisenbacteria sp.]|nr:hypothetical protein [Candidatus Eisenbacteria bacterium]